MRRSIIALAGVVALGVPTAAHADQHAVTDGRIFYSVGAILPDPDPGAGSQIYSVNADGTDVRQLTHLVAPAQAGDPDVSPDGTRVLYVSNAIADTYQVWSMRTDGTGQRLVVADPGHDAFVPRWSPNGHRLLFTRCTVPFGNPECTTAIANRDGSGLHDLTRGHWQDFSAAWSPDGSTVAVSSTRGGLLSAISTVPAGGGRPHRITAPDAEAFWPDYSPTGSRILFGNNFDRPLTDHFTMDPDGGHVTRLTHFPDGTTGGFQRYSPTGTHIVFDFYDGTHDWLAVSDADGGNTTLIARTDNLTLPDWGASS